MATSEEDDNTEDHTQNVPHYATLRKTHKTETGKNRNNHHSFTSPHPTIQSYVIDGEDEKQSVLIPQQEEGLVLAPSNINKDMSNSNVNESDKPKLSSEDTKKTHKSSVVSSKGSKMIPPSLTNLFSKPPTPPRRPPARWLSAKRAFEERPIVLKVMEPNDYNSLLQHFTETPV